MFDFISFTNAFFFIPSSASNRNCFTMVTSLKAFMSEEHSEMYIVQHLLIVDYIRRNNVYSAGSPSLRHSLFNGEVFNYNT